MYREDDLLALSGIQHFAFCERQWALINLERQWADSARTVEGHHVHDRVHNPAMTDGGSDRVVSRAVPLVSYGLGLVGQADVVEFLPTEGKACGVKLPRWPGLWQPRPVEYKRGRPKPDDRDAVQLCAQAICLEEMLGVPVAQGDLYYWETRRREHVTLDPALRLRVSRLAEKMHVAFAEGATPHAERGKHCRLCSIVDLCLPELTVRPRSVRKYVGDEVHGQQ